MKRFALIILCSLLLAGCANEPKPEIEMTILTNSRQIRLVDESGQQVGTIEFDEEVSLTIKRKRQ